MKRSALNEYPPHTPEYVVMHARYQASRGRKPSAILTRFGHRNPKQALKLAELLAYFPPTINLRDAKKIAEIFRRFDKVQAVEVFGSVARGQEGKDLDLILVCDEKTSQLFIDLVEFEAKVSTWRGVGRYRGYAFTRSNIAKQILVADIARNGNEFNNALEECKVSIDIFIFPPDWRNRLTELQSRMAHDDPKFMEKIAKDARRIA